MKLSTTGGVDFVLPDILPQVSWATNWASQVAGVLLWWLHTNSGRCLAGLELFALQMKTENGRKGKNQIAAPLFGEMGHKFQTTGSCRLQTTAISI